MARNKKKEQEFIVGRLSVNARGFGFVTPEDVNSEKDTDIFIPPSKMSSALNGDRVKVKLVRNFGFGIHSEGRDKREGRIVKIIERVNTNIIGTYKSEHNFHYVEADDARLPQFILIHNAKDFKELKNGMKVVVEITHYSNPMSGIISEILGKRKEPGVDILAVIRRYGVNPEFPQEVLEAASKVEKEPSKAEKSNRVSRRKFKIVTIDGEDAKDLDDGVYAEKKPDGSYFLGVYIADVSYYVRANEPLDVEAFERGTSIYPVDRVVPMLPKELSNGICSLNAGVDRLAMACEMTLNAQGEVKHYKIFPTVIHVHKRLTYTAVNDFFNDELGMRNEELIQNAKCRMKNEGVRSPNSELVKRNAELDDIADILNTLREIRNLRWDIREKRGAIDFDLTEIKIILDDKGHPIDIIKRERNLAESVIEECMLVANETVAKHMFDLRKPFIYRVHEQPDKEKIDSFNSLLSTFGLHINRQPDGSIKPMDIQRVLNKVKGTRAEKVISTIALRSMQQARYTAEQSMHFGLAAEYYTHFTSPIRRYPDLIVHRLLRESFNFDKNKNGRKHSNRKHNAKMKDLLANIAKQSSERERRAIEIERETTDLKAVEYMQKFVGKYFNGVIVSVTKFGFFVEIPIGVDGLVRVASIEDDHYTFVDSEFALIGQRTGNTFKIGDEVRVRLIEANVALKQLTFILENKIVANDELIVE